MVLSMTPSDYMTRHMDIEVCDYKIRKDGALVALLEISSDSYLGEIELTSQEIP
jgi:hypothetical protein